MSKTHKQVLETAETRLLKAMIDCDSKELLKLIHRDFVLNNENGETISGIEKLQNNESCTLRYKTAQIRTRSMNFFNNVAIVNSLEKRTGDSGGMPFERDYRITRIWKFNGRSWCVVAASVVLV